MNLTTLLTTPYVGKGNKIAAFFRRILFFVKHRKYLKKVNINDA